MKRLFSLFLVFVLTLLFVSPLEAGRCSGKREKKAPEFSISACRLLAPWPYKCRKCEDIDTDGINDCIDKCLGTPSGAVVDASGCPVDADGDGVYDGLDKCPGTPKGATVDASGCPVDSDGDGVFDGLDKCPDTPKDLAVDEYGCPIKISELETRFLDTGVITTSKILFETGKADLKPESKAVIDEIGEILVKWPQLKIEIGGHTDSQGSEKSNLALSEQRAAAVRAYLVDKYPKMNTENLTAKGYGEAVPVAANDTPEGRLQNRRVEFTVLNKETLKTEIEKQGYKKR